MDLATFAAFVTRGLEDVAATELTSGASAVRVLETRPKVVLTQAADPRTFRDRRTVDDVAVVSAESSSVDDLSDLTSLIADDGDLKESIEIARRMSRMDGPSPSPCPPHTPGTARRA